MVKLLVFVSLMYYIASQLIFSALKHPFHEDEVTFVERSRYVDWYIAHDIYRPEWSDIESIDTPKLPEFIYGLLIRLTSGNSVNQFLYKTTFFENNESRAGDWRISYSRDYCCSINDLPPFIQKKIYPILIARAGVVMISIISLILIYNIGLIMKNEWCGIVSVAIIGNNPLFQLTMHRAMEESPLVLFSLLFICLVLMFYDKLFRTRINFLVVLLLGLIAGLATASKYNGIINILSMYLCFSSLVAFRKISLSNYVRVILFMTITSYCMFMLVHPFVWNKPIQHTILMVQHRLDGMQSQQLSSKLQSIALLNYWERLQAFYRELLLPGAAFSNFRFDGKFIPIDIFLLIVGILLILKDDNEKLTPIRWWLFSWLSLTIGLIHLNWDRYWIFPVICIGFLQSYALIKLFTKTASSFFTFFNRIILKTKNIS